MALASVNVTQLAPKADVLREITRNDGHWAVQGHSRSSNLLPIELTYATINYILYFAAFPR